MSLSVPVVVSSPSVRDHQWRVGALESLTGQFAIKGRQRDGEGLKGAHGEAVVHGEDVLRDTSKLHHDVLVWKTKEHGSRQQRERAFSTRNRWSLPLSGWMIWKFLTED